MTRTLQVYIIAFLLTSIGLGIFYYKVTALEFPLLPDTRYESWYIEASMSLYPRPASRAGNNPLVARLKLPVGNDNLAIVDENFVAQEFGVERTRGKVTGNRYATFTKRAAHGKETLIYRAVLYRLASPSETRASGRTPAADTAYAPAERYRLGLPEEAPVFIAIDTVLKEALNTSADTLSLAKAIYRLAAQPKSEPLRVISRHLDIANQPPMLASFLLNTAGIPARVAHGLPLVEEERTAQLVQWVEFYHAGNWQAFDPKSGELGLSDDYLTWWYGDDSSLLSAEGTQKTSVRLSIHRNTDNSLKRALWKAGEEDSLVLTLSFFDLPLEAQLVFKLLLLIPLGGLVTSFVRQVIGIKTFGTFMPVLVSLALLQVGLVVGLAFLCVIVFVGLIIRGYFDRLQLLMVPRLSAVLTVVVLTLGLLEVAGHRLGFGSIMALPLLPVVIMTMVVERMSLMWDELGAGEAIRTGFSSALVAILCYYILSQPLVGHLTFVFPELLLVVLAADLLLGRYNGYKLTEYFRFKALEREIRKGKTH